MAYSQVQPAAVTGPALANPVLESGGGIDEAGVHVAGVHVAGEHMYDHLAGTAIEINGDGIRVGPNPFTPNNNGFNDFVRFDFTGAEASTGYIVRIFDMNGKRVRTLTADGQSEIIWDGTDSGGTVLKPGVYLYIIERSNRVVRRGSVTLAL